ncbi:hypothetical protein [Thalassospira lucentensis]|uniref:hypothetical protein n=1 Tax=Thalassospira lucentensis TaxID=168935 RepID=UPI00048C96AB|nr:hypothetical protein [Thalassospira lucentensis]RCK18826.1 hypothetical protein TH1_22210 [Thalassospira lucentensis MCCC 1A00383 = DSM 14000]
MNEIESGHIPSLELNENHFPIVLENFFDNSTYGRMYSNLRNVKVAPEMPNGYAEVKVSKEIINLMSDKAIKNIADQFFKVKWVLSSIELHTLKLGGVFEQGLPYPYSSIQQDEMHTCASDTLLSSPLILNFLIPLSTEGAVDLEFSIAENFSKGHLFPGKSTGRVALKRNSVSIWSAPLSTRIRNSSRQPVTLVSFRCSPIFINRPFHVGDLLNIRELNSADKEVLKVLGIGLKYPKIQPQPNFVMSK